MLVTTKCLKIVGKEGSAGAAQTLAARWRYRSDHVQVGEGKQWINHEEIWNRLSIAFYGRKYDLYFDNDILTWRRDRCTDNNTRRFLERTTKRTDQAARKQMPASFGWLISCSAKLAAHWHCDHAVLGDHYPVLGGGATKSGLKAGWARKSVCAGGLLGCGCTGGCGGYPGWSGLNAAWLYGITGYPGPAKHRITAQEVMKSTKTAVLFKP